MPTTPPQLDPEEQLEAAAPETVAVEESGAPLSFVPHDALGKPITTQVKIRSGRFGELDEHELIHLLDSIEDERARARFRESVYLSVFVWIAIAGLVLYGPKYIWHAPELISPAAAIHKQEMVTLNAPVMPHHAAPVPRLDKSTLQKMRAMNPKPALPPTPQPQPAPTATQPQPAPPTPPLPSAPAPVHSNSAPVPDAPLPAAPAKPVFPSTGSVSDSMHNLATKPGPVGSSSPGIGGYTRGGGRGASAGVGGPEILSDTRGVDFQPYLARIMRQIYQQWIPLIPEEAQPPLNKRGITQVRFTINPDGSVGGMWLDGPSGDVALDRAAWGSVNGQIFPHLPPQFTGPNLELRIHYLVNIKPE